jgi:uncharacterized protein YkwD
VGVAFGALLWVSLWGQIVSFPEPAGDERIGLRTLNEARRQRGLSPCREDRRLTATARETSRALLETPDRAPDTAWTTFAARQLGVADAVLRPFALRYQRLNDALPRLLDAPSVVDPRATDCGVGVADQAGTRVLTVVTVRREASIDPFPVTPARGVIATLSGRLADGFARPRVFVTRPDGSVARVLMLPRAHGFAAELAFPQAGGYQIEVLADGDTGPEPVALLSAWVDMPPPRRPVVMMGPAGETDAGAVAHELHALLDAARARAGLPPLEPDPVLARLARDHAIDMRQGHFFGHVSPTRGNLADRMRAAGIGSPRVAENVARGPSAARIDANVMASPAHRANVLDPILTHVGVGVAEVAPGDLIAVMVFATDPSWDH